MAKMSRSEEVCGSPSRIATNEVSGRSDDGKPASEPHANPASPAADGKLDPASLADKIDALAEKATEIQLWGNCACDGFSVGHEPGCTRKVVGTATRLKERDARKMAALVMDNLPTLTRALRDAERMREALTAHDAKAAECPVDAGKFRGTACGTCGARPNEDCIVKARAADRFVDAARQALGDNT